MKDLVEFVAKSLVDNPDAVQIRETGDEVHSKLELTVGPGDMGRIIGRNGKVAKALRLLLRAAGDRSGRRTSLDIIDPTESK